jgi:hypothetical protein
MKWRHLSKADDYYAVLGVQRDASADAIRDAYFTLVRLYHPDVNPDDPEAAKNFKRLQRAFEALSDPDRRKTYDKAWASIASSATATRSTTGHTVPQSPNEPSPPRRSSISPNDFPRPPRRPWVRDPLAAERLLSPAQLHLVLGFVMILLSYYAYSESRPSSAWAPPLIPMLLGVIMLLGALSMFALLSVTLAVLGITAMCIGYGPIGGLGVIVGGWSLYHVFREGDAFRYW